MKSTPRVGTLGVVSLPRKHRWPDSVWMNQSNQTVLQRKGEEVKRESECWRQNSTFLVWIPLTRAAAALFHWREQAFAFGNPFSGYPCFRDIFNIELHLHSCTAKPKEMIFHLLVCRSTLFFTSGKSFIHIYWRNLWRRVQEMHPVITLVHNFHIFFNFE